MKTFVSYPETRSKVPVVLVIHEIFGMTDWVEDLADQVAAAGFIAVAPDLLSGMAPNGGGTADFASGEVGRAIGKLSADQKTADLNAVANYGLKLPGSSGKLFVTGYCWGGGESFRFATNRPELAAAFVFYGVPPAREDMARIKAPVYGFYAGNDARIDATIPDTETAMKELGKEYEPVTYAGAGHGFMRAGEDPGGTEATHAANVQARQEAWVRWKKLLGQ
ncbi:MAG TPA: dienelactone hydrolase family protein [Bryobacteraceae bacterium]|nr:dienelactone hydrolase family protein [Bryobacteraceae bacterium]